MSQAVEFTPSSVDRPLIQKLFKKFQLVYGMIWKAQFDGIDANEAIDFWYDELSSFSQSDLIAAVKEACAVHKEFPPKIGQVVDLCLKHSGVPTADNIIGLMIRRDFNHPLVKVIYEQVGNWALSHDSTDEIKAKVRNIYGESLNTYRENPSAAWGLLEQFKALPEPDPIPPKIPTPREIIGWRKRLAQYQEMAARDKAALKPADHPVWDVVKITIGHPDFDDKMFNERKQYLTSLDEAVAFSLIVGDQYDRIRLLREEVCRSNVKAVREGTCTTHEDKTQPRSYFGAKKGYKQWMRD